MSPTEALTMGQNNSFSFEIPDILKVELFAGNPKTHSRVEVTGLAMSVFTADDRLIVQRRSIKKPHMLTPDELRGSDLYGGVPGVSIASHLNIKMNEDGPNNPEEIDTSYIIASAIRQANTELRLEPETFDTIHIVGIATDKQQLCNEFLIVAKTHLTAKQLKDNYQISNKNSDTADFERKFIDIEATPVATSTLLTDVKSSLPPTHAAAMVALGYLLTFEKNGEQAASQWSDELSHEMSKHYDQIDQIVAKYYERFPEAAQLVPERYWGKTIPTRNLYGYSPAYTPEEQGLPNLDDELVRTGLKFETRTAVTKAHLFDVDGVLSDPHVRKVIHEELFDELIKRLQANEPIALNTGRSVDWVLTNVTKPLIGRITDTSILARLSIIGEKGNTWAVFNEHGEIHRGQTQALSLPEPLKQKVANLMRGDKEFNSMMTVAVDPYKVTMISPEMSLKPKGISDSDHLAKFHATQDRFAQVVQTLLEEAKLTHLFKVDKTTIATDVESPYAGKDLGADRFLEILKAQKINFKNAEFTTYGDSASDLEMAKEINRRGYAGKFVYVGKGIVAPSENYDFPVVKPEGEYTRATLTYLLT